MKSGKNGLYEDIKHQILTMELDPDQDLDEVSLGLRYGLSRTPSGKFSAVWRVKAISTSALIAVRASFR